MPDDPQPDYFFPAAFTLGEGGNIVAIESADFEKGGVRGFRLFDAEGAEDNPEWIESEGGLDTNSIIVQRLSLRAAKSAAALTSYIPNAQELVVLVNGTGERWLLWCTSAFPGGSGSEVVFQAVGAPAPIQARTADTVTTDNTNYPGTPQGPTITVPVDGTYDVTVGARCAHDTAGADFTAFTLGQGVGAVSHELVSLPGSGAFIYQEWTRYRISLSAGDLSWFGRSPSGVAGGGGGTVCSYAHRTIAIRPLSLRYTV